MKTAFTGVACGHPRQMEGNPPNGKEGKRNRLTGCER
jgi:hypothetical protein